MVRLSLFTHDTNQRHFQTTLLDNTNKSFLPQLRNPHFHPFPLCCTFHLFHIYNSTTDGTFKSLRYDGGCFLICLLVDQCDHVVLCDKYINKNFYLLWWFCIVFKLFGFVVTVGCVVQGCSLHLNCRRLICSYAVRSFMCHLKHWVIYRHCESNKAFGLVSSSLKTRVRSYWAAGRHFSELPGDIIVLLCSPFQVGEQVKDNRLLVVSIVF